MKIMYGKRDNHINVTQIALEKCINKDGILFIPSDNHKRAAIFTDSLVNTQKSIFVELDGNITEYNINQEIELTIIKYMEPFFNPNDKSMFYKYLNTCKYYFEYGSGGSTYHASMRDNIKLMYSIESDLAFINKVKQNIENKPYINLIHIDMKTKINTWGYPGEESCIYDWNKYSGAILEIDKAKALKIDLILIDGRFRVACCLKCCNIINDNCYIIFDDFLNRPEYHICLNYYNIIEQTPDNCMVILQKKQTSPPSLEIINKYEQIPD